MGLTIIRAADPIRVERLNLVLYAQPGIGKTSLAFTADLPLLLDFDNGAHRAANRKDTVRITNWSDVADITAADLAPFKTVIVDTAGRALDVLAADIIRTVAVTPTLTSVAVLGAIVVIRTFLSMSLQLEVEGRFPWQKRDAQAG